MRIGIVVDNEFSYDVRVTREAKILQKAGHQVFVLCFDFGQKKYPFIEGITTVRIKWKKMWKDRLFFLFNAFPFYEHFWAHRIGQFINNHKIKILYTHDLYMSKAAFLGIRKSRYNIPFLLDLHENFPAAVRSYNWAKRGVRKLIAQPERWSVKEEQYLNYADRIIVLSEHFKRDLCSKYKTLNPDDFLVFPNVIDFEEFARFTVEPVEKELSALNNLFFYFGGVAERRGIFETIDALREVLSKGFEANLLIIGPVDKADRVRFEQAINGPLVQANIFYIPWIKLRQLPSYMAISHVCLSPIHKNPQHDSGVANKIYQYMYGQRAILASHCKPQQDLIKKYNCGLVYATQEEFVQQMITFIQQPELCKEMGENGYQGLMRDFNTAKFNNRLIDGIRELEVLIKK